MRSYTLTLALLLCASCATPAPADRLANSACGDLRIVGEPGAFTLSGASLGEVSVASPEWCERGQSHYIRVTREPGARVIVNDRSGPQGCDVAVDEAGVCETAPITPLLRAILARTQAAGIVGSGGGPDGCTDLRDPVPVWRWSIGVHDWADADATARIIAEELERWDISGGIAVSVAPRECVTLE